MGEDKLLDTVRSELVVRLRGAYNIETIPDLTACAQTIESYLCSFVCEKLSEASPVLIPGSTASTIFPEIELNGHSYAIRTGEDARDKSVLQVALVPCHREASPRKPRFKQFKLSGYGQYRKAAIALPTELNADHGNLAALVSAIFQTGYTWLEQEAARIFNNPELALGTEIYRHIRSVIPNETLTQNIWIGCGIKQHGMYLVDLGAARSAMSIIGKSRHFVGQNAVELMGELLGVELPIDEMFSTVAVREGKCTRFDLSRSKYKDRLPRLSRTELALYGEDWLSIFPIFRSSRDFLVVGFPSRLEGEILPPIMANRDQLARLFEQSRNRFTKLLRMIRVRTGVDPVERVTTLVACAAGTLLGAFMNAKE